jgi:uncharacterized protein (UPF0276 family)
MTGSFSNIKANLPTLGIGLGLRRELADETIANADQIDFLELVPENYMRLGGNARKLLERVLGRFPLVTHGINLSVGSTDELNMDYLKALKTLLDEIEAPWWSDHLCFTSVDGIYMQDLLPLPFSNEAITHISDRVKRVQDYIQRPFLLENISFYMYLPGNEMLEAEFMTRVLEESDCGLLLDVNNVYVNATNHGFDAREFLDAIPMERTVQMHIAGHKRAKECLIDTHGAPVIQPVYELLDFVLRKVPVKAVMLERDQNFPEFTEILDELSLIRSIAEKAQPELLKNNRSKNAHALTA